MILLTLAIVIILIIMVAWSGLQMYKQILAKIDDNTKSMSCFITKDDFQERASAYKDEYEHIMYNLANELKTKSNPTKLSTVDENESDLPPEPPSDVYNSSSFPSSSLSFNESID